MKQPCEIIKIDKYTRKIDMPTLLLMNRSFNMIGKISRYDNWNISLVGNGIDEISFDVHKYVDGKLCPVWDELIDLKIVDVSGFGRFEISVDYTDNTETVKSVHGASLETELAQIGLYEFHVNDEEAADMVITEYSKDNYDSEGNFIPTTFYREILDGDTSEEAEFKRKHSLLHRVLADKAPHWSIGYVTPYIALGEDVQPEESSKFQRTYTVDGDSIYDFLTGTVAEESNVIFVFDTIERKINCYSLCDCIDQKTGKLMVDDDGHEVTGIGEDTTVFVSKNKLANEITISSNKDNVKNCFRIVGGDDVITDMVRAVNMNGSSYIHQFADFQYNDMSEELKGKIQDYQAIMSSKETQDQYYGENGIYTRLCKAYDDLAYYESSMMPDTEKVTEVGEAKAQYDKVVAELEKSPVAVSSMSNYGNNLFLGVTNNIEAYAQIFLDSRFDLEIVDGTTSYSYVENSATGTWKGKIRITQHTNEKNVYPVDVSSVSELEITVNADELEFAKQKVHKALSKSTMADIDFNVAGMDETGMRNYFNQYALNRLKSFADGYNSCLSILADMGQKTASDVQKTLYSNYEERYRIVESIRIERQKQVDTINAQIEDIKKEQSVFQYGDEDHDPHDFRTYIGDELYLEFCKYRREDTYTNSNYISDGLSTAGCLAKAKELIEVATKEAKKACVLQRTVSTSLNNLFALPEFEPLYEKFALFNFIRIRTEDEILKLRLIGIEFSGDSVEEIQVTFSEQIESVDGKMSDLQSIIQQASSMATSYPSTTLQAKQGANANNEIVDMHTNGLSAAKTMLSNNDNNEVTITQAGILCKRMDDEGFYGDKQFRLTGNMMAFTRDCWKSVELAIGETAFTNPITGENIQGYGIIAENLVGKFIAGESAYIGNESGSVLITGNGITLNGGHITWTGTDTPIKSTEIFYITTLNKLKPSENNSSWNSSITSMTDGMYLWQKTITTDSAGNKIVDIVCIGGTDNIESLKMQYYPSTSKTSQVGGSWSDILPSYSNSNDIRYIWTRNYITYKSGTFITTTPIYDSALTNAIYGYEAFKNNVEAALTGSTTDIGSDYVISPKIGGGYLYISDKRITNNTGISIEINPNGTSFDGHNASYVFNVSKGNDVVMGVTNNGDGYFSGKITAESGNIGGWNIKNFKLEYIDDYNPNNFIQLNSINKSIVSQNGYAKSVFTAGYLDSTDGTYSARLSNAGLYFKKDNIDYALFQSTYWKGTEIRGVGVNSFADSKFISFGNKTDNLQDSFITPLVLNYGLNPDGNTQDVLIYGSVLISGNLSIGELSIGGKSLSKIIKETKVDDAKQADEANIAYYISTSASTKKEPIGTTDTENEQIATISCRVSEGKNQIGIRGRWSGDSYSTKWFTLD